MPRIAMLFGALLVALGAYGFFTTGAAHPTALIPAYFGAVLLLCGLLAHSMPAKRALWMHIAVTIGLLGFLIPLARIVMHWSTMPAAAQLSHAGMTALCLIFTVLCVMSFIKARRARAAV